MDPHNTRQSDTDLLDLPDLPELSDLPKLTIEEILLVEENFKKELEKEKKDFVFVLKRKLSKAMRAHLTCELTNVQLLLTKFALVRTLKPRTNRKQRTK